MTIRTTTGRFFPVVAGLLAVAMFVVACGGDDATSTPAAADPTQTPAGVSQATPTQSAEATATAAQTATVPAATATNVATATVAVTATVEATATSVAPTATVDATATPADTTDPLGDIDMLDPELLPNFTLDMRLEFAGVPDEFDELSEETLILELNIQQSALTNYYMRFSSDEMHLEIWLVDGTTYVTQEDGTIVSMPGSDMGGMFSPSLFLQTTPTFEPELEARQEGEETVSGRQTTRYSIDARNYLAMSDLFDDGVAPDDATGTFTIWVDNELSFPIRYESDIRWTNDDGTSGYLVANYLVSAIGSTAEVAAPQ